MADSRIKQIIILTILLVSVSAVSYLVTTKSGKTASPVLKIGSETISVQVADTEIERMAGLSRRRSLPRNQGLLLIFDELDKHGIWMKDMKFSIDVVWLDENFKVVDLKENISPDTYPKIFTPDSPALYVLEINAGVSDEYGIKIGDKFELYTLFSNS